MGLVLFVGGSAPELGFTVLAITYDSPRHPPATQSNVRPATVDADALAALIQALPPKGER